MLVNTLFAIGHARPQAWRRPDSGGTPKFSGAELVFLTVKGLQPDPVVLAHVVWVQHT